MSTTSISRRSKLQRNKTITSFGDTISHGEQSGPICSIRSSVPEDIITYRHSYGYNCKKPYNLYLLGSETLVFLSGNLIHFLNTRTLELTVRRSVLGTGIGCITKNSHPNYLDFLTIGENGDRDPPILIYNYPDMELQRKLVGGARRNHTRVTYSADGEWLASQSGEPDFILTIWKWRDAEILLRLQSFAKDVYNLKFSSFTSELLSSSGAGHIKFWKIRHTFTGLKLQGDVGRFGKTEISDIYGLYQLEDGKVLSGSDWGNILVWENNSIKYEVFRKNHKTCHNGPITQIICHDQEVLTISLDGYVRLWFWETVESSCPADDENFVEVEPIFEVKIGTRDEECQLMSMVKDPDPAANTWYIQDGNGGIWSCNFSSNGSAGGSRQLYKCHAGAIIAAVTSPFASHISTLGADGRLHIYDYALLEMVYQRRFLAKGAAIVWPSLSVASAGNNLIVAFESGVIRLLAIEFDDAAKNMVRGTRLIQVLKSHTRAITQMSVNRTEEILVTGAEDHTVFVHGIVKGNSMQLIPIGLVVLTSLITSLNWNLFKSPTTILIGCRFGEIFEIELPDSVQDHFTDLSYELKDLPTRMLRFKSKKSEIRRLVKVKNVWYRKTFKIDEESLQESMAGLEEGEEQQPADSHFVPPIPNKVLWLEAISRDRLWVSMAQFDAGYIYEYKFGTEDELQRVIPIPGGSELEINSFLKVNDMLIFGLSNGVVRVTKVKEDPTDFGDYWQLGMHDNENGIISSIAFSGDPSKAYLFTSGFDGNLFQYKWIDDRGCGDELAAKRLSVEHWSPMPEVDDVDDQAMLAYEQEKRKINDDQRHTVCEANKSKVVNILTDFKERFNRIWSQNQALPESQRVDAEAFELDKRITDDLNETLERKMKMAQREMQYDVEKARIGVRKLMTYFIDPLESFPIEVLGIRCPVRVESFRVRKLDEDFHRTRGDLARRMNQFKEESKERRQSMSVEFSRPLEKIPAISSNEEEFRVHRIESILREMGEGRKFSNLHTKIRRLLTKYKERKAYELERKQEWEAINQQKPNPDIDHPDDVQAMAEGQNTIGDFKLKLDDDYIPPENGSDSLLIKLAEILDVQERVFGAKKEYNDQIRQMRLKKEELLRKIKHDAVILQKIHSELPENMRLAMIEYNDINEDVEYPEKFIGVKPIADRRTLKLEGSGGALDPLTLFLNKSAELTEVEGELKAQRIQEKAFEQDLLLETAANEINQFDNDLKQLSQHRLTVEMDTLFLDSYLLTLQKEYNIIHGYYEEETRLSALVDDKRIENGQYLSKILTQESALEMAKKNIEMYKAEKRILQQTFDSNCLDNKFTDFLRWIFEKGEEDVDNSIQAKESFNSMSYSSGSLEGSSVSISSSNYDETFCPRGCDPDLYKLAFELRTSRFEMNRKIAEEYQVYDRVKGDLEFLTKEIMVIQQEQATREADFIALRREKQRKLNDIDTFLVLRQDQLQYFKDESEFGDISRTLLFERRNLMRLYARVGELSSETAEIKRKHRVNIVLLSRLKTDCHYLDQLEAQLKDNIKDAMVKKFGMPINLDELQEALLKRLLFEIRLNVGDVEREFRQKISEHKMSIQEKQIELTKTIQEGTEKLNILTVLHEEKNNLDEVLANQIKLRRKKEEKRMDFSKDIDRLRRISRDQLKQIESLQRDIRTLSLKCKPFSSVPALPAISLPHEWRERHGKELLEFEGSAYASILTSEPSSDGMDAQFTDRLRGQIERIVVKYLRKQLQHRLMEKQLIKVGHQVVGYFLRVLSTFDHSRRDELLPCIVEDFLKFLPRESSLVLSHSSVVHLFDRVLRTFRQQDEVDAKEIIWGIIENASEVVIGLPGDPQERINRLLIEIWRQFFVTLPIGDVQEESFAKEVYSCLNRLNDFNWSLQNPDLIFKEVNSFVLDNSPDEITPPDIEKVLRLFFSYLS